MKRTTTALSAALLLILTAGCGSPTAPTPATSTTATAVFTASGGLTLTQGPYTGAAGTTCSGKGGFADITGGAQVKISDASGKVVALGELETGATLTFTDCYFSFSVDGVPDSGDIYGVEVANRSVIQFRKADAESIELTLGV